MPSVFRLGGTYTTINPAAGEVPPPGWERTWDISDEAADLIRRGAAIREDGDNLVIDADTVPPMPVAEE